jgi:uncharacterized protein YecE (DUF72 family)
LKSTAVKGPKSPHFPHFSANACATANIHRGFGKSLRDNARMAQIWFGTSGFSYKEWRPIFYPEGLSEKEFLRYYSSRLNSVEIDYTFYRMPSQKTIDAWKSATPKNFKFTIKASQQITHRQRLKIPSEALDYFVTTVAGLGDRLGLVLYQLPPFFKADRQKLEVFLSVLPRGSRAAFEFRHESWFTSDVFQTLRDHGAGLCVHDADDHTTPLELTADFTYVRLRRSEYSDAERKQWQQRIQAWAKDGIEVFAYIKHEDNPNAPLIALDFVAGLPIHQGKVDPA